MAGNDRTWQGMGGDGWRWVGKRCGGLEVVMVGARAGRVGGVMGTATKDRVGRIARRVSGGKDRCGQMWTRVGWVRR